MITATAAIYTAIVVIARLPHPQGPLATSPQPTATLSSLHPSLHSLSSPPLTTITYSLVGAPLLMQKVLLEFDLRLPPPPLLPSSPLPSVP